MNELMSYPHVLAWSMIHTYWRVDCGIRVRYSALAPEREESPRYEPIKEMLTRLMGR